MWDIFFYSTLIVAEVLCAERFFIYNFIISNKGQLYLKLEKRPL